jgi:poly(A) polymerase
VARDGRVYDYTGGLADLDARRVRFIGEAKNRIEEDYLRILRFFRFHAAYGAGEPDADGVTACIAARAGLTQLSRERVRMEMMKLIVARRAVPALQVMAEIGLLLDVLGGVPNVVHAARMAEIEQALALAADPVRRLGSLAVVVAEDAERLWQRLRLTNKEYERLAAMAEGWHRISPALNEQAQRVLLYRLGPELFADQALLGFARSQAEANDAGWQSLATLPQRWTVPVFPLKAADFIRRGVAQGPALGAALRAAESAWLAADFPDDAAAIARIADEAANSVKN